MRVLDADNDGDLDLFGVNWRANGRDTAVKLWINGTPTPDVLFTSGADKVDLNDFNLAAYDQATDALGGDDEVVLSETQNVGVPFVGADGADTIFGSSKGDEVSGQNSNDRLWGRQGDDLLRGGVGNDRLFGQGGNDELMGNSGGELLDGGPARTC
jgi:Ca2+-binding RTX toxin-like protein